jgi:sterol desaturase/sphingolipid hydroxylase (fatty acid hydroxylase superfamily)
MEFWEFLRTTYSGNSLQWITTSVTIGSALLLIGLERVIPYTKGQRFLREGLFGDFFLYTIAQNYVLGLVIFGLLEFVDTHTAFHRISLIRELPVWVQVLVFLITHDFYIYWFHRLQHNSRVLWRTHEAHHSTLDVDWLSGSRSHSVEILINQTIEFAPIILLASPEVALIKGCIDAVWGMYIHSNVDVRSGILQYVFNGPEMHRWHHAVDDEAHNKNFGTKFAVWDWLFGTAYFPTSAKPKGFGLGDTFPKGYLRQHTHAFRPFSDD